MPFPSAENIVPSPDSLAENTSLVITLQQQPLYFFFQFLVVPVATVPPIVKTVYLLRTKSCARFGRNFSIFLLCQVKIPDEGDSRHVYLLGKNINKPLVHFY